MGMMAQVFSPAAEQVAPSRASEEILSTLLVRWFQTQPKSSRTEAATMRGGDSLAK